MKEFKVTVTGQTGTVSYTVMRKSERAAKTMGNKISNEAFFGEETEITVEEA